MILVTNRTYATNVKDRVRCIVEYDVLATATLGTLDSGYVGNFWKRNFPGMSQNSLLLKQAWEPVKFERLRLQAFAE